MASEKTPLAESGEKKAPSMALTMGLFLLMVVMSSVEPVISKWAVPESDAKKPFHLRPSKVSIEVWNYLMVLIISSILIYLKSGDNSIPDPPRLEQCLAWNDGMKHFLTVEAFHGSSRVTKLFALASGASSSMMKVITQAKLLITGCLNKYVGREVTLNQWLLISAVTVLVYGFIQTQAEIDGARKEMATAVDTAGHHLWSGYLPPAWVPKGSAGPAPGFFAQNAIVLMCCFSVLLSTLSLFTGDLAFKKNKYHFLVQMVQARIIGFCVVLLIGIWSFYNDYSKTFKDGGKWLNEDGVMVSGNMAEAYGYADGSPIVLFFQTVFCFKNWTAAMVLNVLFQVGLAYTITYVLKSLDALWKGMGSSLSVAGTFVLEVVILPVLYAGGSGSFDSLVKKDTLFKDHLKTFSGVELAIVMGIVATVASYGVTKMEASAAAAATKKAGYDKKKAAETLQQFMEAKGGDKDKALDALKAQFN